MDTEPAFREQQIAEDESRTLKPVSDVKDLWHELEAVADVQGCRDHTRIIAKRGTKHLPEVALLRLGGDPSGRAGTLAVDDHDRSFDHSGHAQTLAHEGEASTGRRAHSADARVRSADDHVDYADLVFHLADHDSSFAGVRGHPVENAGRRAHGVSAIEFHAGSGPTHRHGNVATQNGIPILRLGQRVRKSCEVCGGVIIASARDSEVFCDDSVAFFLELLFENFFQRRKPDTHHVETCAYCERILRNLIASDVR